MSKKGSIFKWIGAITMIMVLFLAACKDPVEGCLDVEAVNYDVSADDPCPDCCTYPNLSLAISHRYQDSILFSYDSTYHIGGTNFDTRFEKVAFYLSDFRLVNIDNTDSLEVVETIELDLIGGGTSTFKDDYTFISRSNSSFEYEVGEIRSSGSFSTLRFTVGIAGDAANGDALSITNEEHPLALGTDSLWTASNGYIFHQIIVVPDTLNPPVDSVEIINISGQNNLAFVELPYELDIALGFDVTIPLKIDYEKWFSGINFVGDSTDQIIDSIVNNTTNAFSINE